MVSKDWSKAWVASGQKRKQRKYAFQAPLHIKHRFLNANLAEDLSKQYGVRSVPVRKGDTVKVMAGQFKGQTVKVVEVTLARTKVYLDNLGVKRTDGTVALYPIHPSNLQIVKLDTSDKLRVQKLEKKKSASKSESKVKGGKKE